MILVGIIFLFLAISGLAIVLFILAAFVTGVVQGIKDSWSYWAVRRKYKL